MRSEGRLRSSLCRRLVEWVLAEGWDLVADQDACSPKDGDIGDSLALVSFLYLTLEEGSTKETKRQLGKVKRTLLELVEPCGGFGPG